MLMKASPEMKNTRHNTSQKEMGILNMIYTDSIARNRYIPAAERWKYKKVGKKHTPKVSKLMDSSYVEKKYIIDMIYLISNVLTGTILYLDNELCRCTDFFEDWERHSPNRNSNVCDILADKGVSTSNISIADYMRNTDVLYDIIYLDYECTAMFCLDEIDLAIKRLKKNAILAVTISARYNINTLQKKYKVNRNRHSIGNALYFGQTKDNVCDTVKCVNSIIMEKFVLADTSAELKVVKRYNYCMITFIYKRNF
jgi:hypothetical protein